MTVMSEAFTHEELQNRLREMEGWANCIEEIYNSLFENNHSIMLIIDPNSGNLLDANAAACDYYGYSKHELSKMKIMDINTLSEERVYEEMQQARLAKRKVFNFCHRLASGKVRDVEVLTGPITLAGQRVLYSIVHDVSEQRTYEREREQLVTQLEQALAEIKKLQGILPICASCKRIRDDEGAWNEIESYIRQHSEAEFSHGICPNCKQKLYPNLRSTKPS